MFDDNIMFVSMIIENSPKDCAFAMYFQSPTRSSQYRVILRSDRCYEVINVVRNTAESMVNLPDIERIWIEA